MCDPTPENQTDSEGSRMYSHASVHMRAQVHVHAHMIYAAISADCEGEEASVQDETLTYLDSLHIRSQPDTLLPDLSQHGETSLSKQDSLWPGMNWNPVCILETWRHKAHTHTHTQ